MPIADRRQRERQARIQLILGAALSVFANRGYHATSMDLIAAEAELGKATLYYYFKSKDELLIAILENGLREFFSMLESAWKNLDNPLEKIKKVAEVGAEFFIQYPDYFKLYHYLTVHPSLREMAFQQLHPLIVEKTEWIKSEFQKALDAGQIQSLPLDILIEIFGSLIMGMGLFTHPPVQAEKLRQKASLINQIFLEGILSKKGVA